MHPPATRPVAVKLDQGTREAIEQYVNREEKREAFRQDGLRAWADYQSTGQHVTDTEADAWLEQLETGNDVEPPKCHG